MIKIFLLLLILPYGVVMSKSNNKKLKDEDIKKEISIKIDNSENNLKNENQDQKEKEEEIKTIKFKLKIKGLLDSQYGYYNKPGALYDNSGSMINGLSNAPQWLNTQRLQIGDNFNVRAIININPEIEDKNGIKYGAFFGIPLRSNDTDPKTASQEYAYVDFKYFKFEGGSTFSAASKMRIDPSKISSGTGGAYGDWWRYIMPSIYNITGLSNSISDSLNYGYGPLFMIYPTLPNEAGATVPSYLGGAYFSSSSILSSQNLIYSASNQFYPTQGARSNKVSFYTKRFYGVQIGISYSPTTMQTGFINSFSNSIAMNTLGGYVQNYVSYGINYKKQFQKFALGLSFTHELGEYKSPYTQYNLNGINTYSDLSSSGFFNKNNLNAFALGFQLNYQNFGLSYAYGYWGNSLQPINAMMINGYTIDNRTSDYHVLALAFNFGRINLSASYMRSNYNGNTIDLVSLGTDFTLASLKYIRMVAYMEYNWFNLSPRSVFIENIQYKALSFMGNIFIVGMKFVF